MASCMPLHLAFESSPSMPQQGSSSGTSTRVEAKPSGARNEIADSYWNSGQERRLFFGLGPWLYALDPANGQPVKNFGEDGRIDLRQGLGRGRGLTVQANSPGVIYRDMLIMGML